MWEYLLVFFMSFLVDSVPFIGPPAWTVMVFFQMRYHLNIWVVLVVGVIGSALGRYVLSKYIPYLSLKVIRKEKNEDIQFVGQKLLDKGWRVQLFVLLYTLVPLPSTPLFTASGMAIPSSAWPPRRPRAPWATRSFRRSSMRPPMRSAASSSERMVLLERSVSDMQSRFASVTLTQHAVLLAAKTFESKGEHDKAKSALSWVAKQADDEGLAALARWRLAGLQIQDKQWDAAKESLTAHPVPPAMRALFDERFNRCLSIID